MRTRFALISLLIACAAVASQAQNTNTPRTAPRPRPQIFRPDLIIQEYEFAPTNNKSLRVKVANIGNGIAGACFLRLTIRKIKGVAVGRTKLLSVPAISVGGHAWITFIADGILPNDVDIKNTTFKLNVDITNSVIESKETNNEKWHNL